MLTSTTHEASEDIDRLHKCRPTAKTFPIRLALFFKSRLFHLNSMKRFYQANLLPSEFLQVKTEEVDQEYLFIWPRVQFWFSLEENALSRKIRRVVPIQPLDGFRMRRAIRS